MLLVHNGSSETTLIAQVGAQTNLSHVEWMYNLFSHPTGCIEQVDQLGIMLCIIFPTDEHIVMKG